MNFCRRCESEYDKPGTCNCYAWNGTVSYAQVACEGCGKIPCDHSDTRCPLPIHTVMTCTPLPAGSGRAWVDVDMSFTPTLGVASAFMSGLPV